MSLGSNSDVEPQQQQQQQQLECASTASPPAPTAKAKRQRPGSQRRPAVAAAAKPTQHRNWTPDEDKQLLELVAKYDVLKTKRWTHIAELMGTGRIGKQCRDRYLNHIDPCVVKTPWTPEEDYAIIEAQRRLGNVWTKIAEVVGNGRAANGIKNRWNSCLKRRVMLSGKSSGSDSAESSPSLPSPPLPPPPKRMKKSHPPPARPQPVIDKTPAAEPSSLVTFPVPEETQPFRVPVAPVVLAPPPPISINDGPATKTTTMTAPGSSSPMSVGTSLVSSPSLFEQEDPVYTEGDTDMLPFLTAPDANTSFDFLTEPGQSPWFVIPELDAPL